MIIKSYLLEKSPSNFETKILLFYGENLGFKNEIKNKIKENNKKAFIKNIDQDEIIKDKDFFLNEILHQSLFEDEKIYFINQASDKIMEFMLELEKKIGEQKIYLFSEILEKKSKLRLFFEKSTNFGTVPCYADTEITLKNIILEKLKGFSGLSNQTLNIIIDNCGLDRTKLLNEIGKIKSYFNKKEIRQDELENLLNLKVNDNFNTLKDHALMGSKDKTNKLLSDTVLEPEKNILYLNFLNQRLTKIQEILKNNKHDDFDNAISKIRPPIFWKDKPIFISQVKKWSKTKIIKALNLTYNIELKIKTNSLISQQLLIKKLLIDLCVLANA